MKTPYFSIVTPTYNIAKYLPRTLRSIESQTFRDFEHIFVDAFSTDGTWEIIQDYVKRNPEIRVRADKRDPQGVFVAQNQGIQLAHGRYINLMNADDFFVDNEVLGDVYTVTINRPEIEWLQGDTIVERQRKVHIRNKVLAGHLFHFGLSFICPILPQSTFMTKELYKRYNYFKTHRKTGMDTDLFVRMAEKEPIYFYDRKIASFTIRPDSVSLSSGPLRTWSSNWVDFYKNYRQIPFLTGAVNTFTKRHLRKFIG